MFKAAIVASIVILLTPMALSSFADDYKNFSGVGKNLGNGTPTFDIQYTSVKNIVSSTVNPKDKSIDFVLVGKTNSSSTLTLKLPIGLINGPIIGVFVDGQIITNYITKEEPGDTLVSIPINPLSENISIVGTTIVPEFGSVATIVLAVATISIVMVTRFRPIRL
jgi:predicted secreted protein with PEFG-CTERM motif